MQGVLRVHIERQHRPAGPLQRRGQVGRQGALADPALGGDHRQNADVIELGRRGNGHHRLLDRRASLLSQLGQQAAQPGSRPGGHGFRLGRRGDGRTGLDRDLHGLSHRLDGCRSRLRHGRRRGLTTGQHRPAALGSGLAALLGDFLVLVCTTAEQLEKTGDIARGTHNFTLRVPVFGSNPSGRDRKTTSKEHLAFMVFLNHVNSKAQQMIDVKMILQ